MGVLVVFLLLALLLFGAGFALPTLWWVALVALVVWAVGWAHGPERRWSRW
ncbi:MAG: hydrophobic protein [Acidimicrobiales bacterium]